MAGSSRRKGRDDSVSRVRSVNEALEALVAENITLRAENEQLTRRNTDVASENAFLRKEIQRLEIDTTTGLFRVAAEDVLPSKEADPEVDVVVMDLFGLKAVNEFSYDKYAQGNRLLRKAGETVLTILQAEGYPPRSAVRIGGDEIAAFVKAGEGWQIAVAIQHTFGIVQMPTVLDVDCVSMLVCASSGGDYHRFDDVGWLTADGRVPQYPKFHRAATIMQLLKDRMKDTEIAEGRLVARTSYHNEGMLRAEGE